MHALNLTLVLYALGSLQSSAAQPGIIHSRISDRNIFDGFPANWIAKSASGLHHAQHSAVNFQNYIDGLCGENQNDFRNLLREVTKWCTNKSRSRSKKVDGSDRVAALILGMTTQSDHYLSEEAIWDLMGSDRRVTVWKLDRSSLKLSKEDRDWPCVKSSTIIEADATSVAEYLLDSSKVMEYNKYSAGRDDVEILSRNTKVVWNRLKIPIGIPPYDFCTMIHYYFNPLTSEHFILSRSVRHDSVPVHKDYGRSEKIIGINIIRPVIADKKSDQPTRSEIVCISHQRYANTPPIMIEKSMMRGKINYLKKLREVLEKR